MKTLLLVGILAVVLVSTACAMAAPTLSGMTGNISLPTAAVLEQDKANLAFDYYDTPSDHSLMFRGEYGVGSDCELGIGYASLKHANTWTLNAKYATPVDFLGFKWSGAFQYASTKDEHTKSYEFFWVGDKAFSLGKDMPSVFSFGVNWASVSLPGRDVTTAARAYGALDVQLSEGLSAVAEYQTAKGHFDAKPLESIGLRYKLNPSLSLQAGWTNASPDAFVGTLKDHRLFVGANYTLGK